MWMEMMQILLIFNRKNSGWSQILDAGYMNHKSVNICPFLLCIAVVRMVFPGAIVRWELQRERYINTRALWPNNSELLASIMAAALPCLSTIGLRRACMLSQCLLSSSCSNCHNDQNLIWQRTNKLTIWALYMVGCV